MTDDAVRSLPARVEPAFRSDERTTLTEFLDYYRATLQVKIDGLTDEQAREAAVPPSDLTLLGLLRHMADVERSWFRRRFTGETDAGPIFYGPAHPTGDEDGDLHPSPDDTVADALAAWQAEIAQARIITAGAELDDLAQNAKDEINLRWILVHMIEEYARHCGHADLLRERIDGSVGD